MLKYVVPEYPWPTLYFGVANVIANGFIMLRYASRFDLGMDVQADLLVTSSVVLWVSQNMEDDYTYNLAL